MEWQRSDNSKAIYLPFSDDEGYEPRTKALVHYMRSRFGKYWNDWHWTYQKQPRREPKFDIHVKP